MYYGDVLPEPEGLLSEVPSLIGTDNQGKMSKSAGNSILLSDDAKAVEKAVKGMYTDPNRVSADVPGKVEGNPVFIYHDLFNPNRDEVEDLKTRYLQGTVGDVEVKQKLAAAINMFLDPFRERRRKFESDKGYVEQVIVEGTMKMNDIANDTLKVMRSAMGLKGGWDKIRRQARDRAEAQR
jgi:tryptophanyl-tRNA synthetase